MKETYFSNKVKTLHFLYNILIILVPSVLKTVALFNKKIKLGVAGRKKTFPLLKAQLSPNDNTIWFHCASLGEYEQGYPVFKNIRHLYKNHKIVLTFFSPSGYEVKKNTDIADVVCYLPWDSKANAKQFVSLINPELTIFVKYDIWPNLLSELKSKNRKALLISALFRKNQHYFKYRFMQKALFAFDHIFTQDEASKHLLENIGYRHVTISGDTRFDRVSSQLNMDNSLAFIERFKQDNLCLVAGSTWPEDEALLVDFINNSPDGIKFIIAPHNIKAAQIEKLTLAITKKVALFSNKAQANLEESNVFIVDTIGLLSKIYNYADIAYVGGAVGHTGLHNTLEAAVFGIPIIIGSHYEKFPEASHMIALGGMFSIKTKTELTQTLTQLIQDSNKRQQAGNQNAHYIKKNTGAVIQIMDFIRN
ncbi:3-deoxy-D-manno-octulosonic acid transferase [Mangrovimonas yunxiaonensis]|uniref:3-deoxy-D-manno-octulosonic acid transferase n=1 Tax=Mangrovimonas yunxiaonensis TaxID=1197477 RepID=UPI000A018517|nr:glycosyltransferase N-terminal domain-containing protein [Mangrovimonas yunxiaonensis]GGH41155.1 3-deoxy-D-manno-octulosonic acid transferase [Mangrovimonas yunxiaonensis]